MKNSCDQRFPTNRTSRWAASKGTWGAGGKEVFLVGLLLTCAVCDGKRQESELVGRFYEVKRCLAVCWG